MSENFCYHRVKVPKGFNYDAVEKALDAGQEVSLWDEACYLAAQFPIQDYRAKFVADFIDGEDGRETVEYEYQTLPFWYTLYPPNPVNWSNDSVEDMIHNSSFWDGM